jgi:hypothetical protein
MPESSPLEVEIAVPELKKYKSPVNDPIPAGLYQAEGETLHFEIQTLVNSIWNREELLQK